MNTEPVALLPVRLETRYSSDAPLLRVRIFPDDIHIDALDQGVDDKERSAATAYWAAVWDLDAEPAEDPWALLVATVGARRAPWVAEALRPTNEAERPATPPAFPAVEARTKQPAQVRTLPARFRAYAFTLLPNGQEALPFIGEGGPVRDPLVIAPGTATDATPIEFSHGIPVLGPDLRWLVEFEEAKAAGMGLEIPLTRPQQPIERLIVVGVRDDLDPTAGAQRLNELFLAHAFTDGLAFVPQGSPTNNTDTDRSAWSRRVSPPVPGPTGPAPAAGSNAEVLARFLDLPVATFSGLASAGDTEQGDARAMVSALWGTTWEVLFAKLTGPTTPGRGFTTEQREDLRDHAITYLRGRGPIPAIRVGRQPYGVLPAIDLPHFGVLTTGITQAGLVGFLQNARRLWRSGVQDVPTVMEGDLEETMAEILGTSPVTTGLRVRSLTQINKCYEPLPFLLDAQDNCATQEGLDRIAHEFIGFDPSEIAPTGALGKSAPSLALPLVADSDPDYIQRLLDGNPPEDEQSVLQAMLGLAASIEADEWSNMTADEGVSRVHDALTHAHELVDVQTVQSGLSVLTRPTDHPDELQTVTRALGAIATTGIARFDPRTVVAAYPIDAIRPRAFVTAATRRSDQILFEPTKVVQISAELLRRFVRRTEFRTDLATVRDLPLATRELLFKEVLDTASHRLDAWVTSLATSRLDGQRQAGIRGVTIGAYGYVQHLFSDEPALDDLPDGVPEATQAFVNPRDGGYVHAPSLDHATTAGILRSARLTHDPEDSGSPALDIDLSSGRVRAALRIIEGIRGGQPLGALLGYRLERWLHERSHPGLELDRYVYVLRTVAPLRTAKLTGPTAGAVPSALESVAAANVVDGVRLLELLGAAGGRAQIVDRLKAGPDGATLTKYIDRWREPAAGEIDAVLQAVEDLEQLHDAVADLLLAESVHQLARGNTGGASAALDAAGGGDAVPPEPDVVRAHRSGTAVTHRLVVLLPEATPAGETGWSDDAQLAKAHPRLEAWAREQLGPASRVILATGPQVTLAGRGLSALDVLVQAGPALRESLGLEPLPERPAAWRRSTDRLLLAEMEELATSLRGLLAAARPLTGSELCAPIERDAPPRAPDLAGLEDRATRVCDDLEATGPPDGSPEARRLLLGRAALAAAGGAPTSGERLQHLEEALSAVLGSGLPAVPELLPPAAPDELSAALAAAQPPSDVVRQWLTSWAAVRPRLGRYASTSTYRQALTAEIGLRVLQLGAGAGERWIGLPLAEGDSPPPRPLVSVLAEVPHGSPPSVTERLAGFVVDEWTDVIPGRTTTTAAAVNAHSPSARPPQVVLVAVTGGDPWNLDRLRDVVDDTIRLAQERAVTLERVPLAPRILPALYVQDWSLQGQDDPVLFVSGLNQKLGSKTFAPKFVRG